jgi:hypothetical protein
MADERSVPIRLFLTVAVAATPRSQQSCEPLMRRVASAGYGDMRVDETSMKDGSVTVRAPRPKRRCPLCLRPLHGRSPEVEIAGVRLHLHCAVGRRRRFR